MISLDELFSAVCHATDTFNCWTLLVMKILRLRKVQNCLYQYVFRVVMSTSCVDFDGKCSKPIIFWMIVIYSFHNQCCFLVYLWIVHVWICGEISRIIVNHCNFGKTKLWSFNKIIVSPRFWQTHRSFKHTHCSFFFLNYGGPLWFYQTHRQMTCMFSSAFLQYICAWLLTSPCASCVLSIAKGQKLTILRWHKISSFTNWP
jgi:hypothetical protein